MTRWFAVIAAFALVLAACGSVSTEGQYGTPEVSGDALLPLVANSTDGSVGATIPSITGTDFNGQTVTIDPANGTPKVILFLAHWCPHCQQEVPLVQEFLDANGGPPDGVEFLSVATSTDPSRPNFPPGAWLDREDWGQAVIVDDEAQTVASAFGLSAFPFWVVVGPDGTVLQRVAGGINIEALPALFDQLTSLEVSG